MSQKVRAPMSNGSQPQITPSSGAMITSPGFYRHMHTCHTHRERGIQTHMHIHINKNISSEILKQML